MFKVLILTEKSIDNLYSNLKRQIFSQKNNLIQYSPIKISLTQNQQNLKNKESPQITNLKSHSKNQQNHGETLFISPQKKQNKQTTKHNEIQAIAESILKINNLKGKLKLFHQYRLEKIQNNFNQEIFQNQIQQLNTLTQFKTNILAILNVCRLNLKIILEKLEQFYQQIQNVDQFYEQHLRKSEKQSNSSMCDLIVYFKNPLLCQEFYKICYQEINVLPVYLKEVVILQRQTSEQISYKDVLKTLNFFLCHDKVQKQQESKQVPTQYKNKYQLQWIQLPKCIDCLLKLQYQVSGINQKVLTAISQNIQPNTNLQCHTCSILHQHRKQTQIHRKLSYEQGYKDTIKSQKHAHCDDCKQKNDIWICMVCGSVGCGRYKNADAYKHFVNSGHIITIDLQTQRVWNYLSDCFSHKILKTFNQPKKNVKFPQIDNQEGSSIENSKLQSAFWQYCSVFSDEMQRQRIFYENIKRSEQEKFLKQKEQLEKIIEELQKQNEEKQLQLRRIVKKRGKIMKREKQLQKKIDEERQIFKQQEECLSVDFGRNLVENDEQVIKKKRQIQSLDNELNDLLIELSKN